MMPHIVFMNDLRSKLEYDKGTITEKERHYRGTEPFGLASHRDSNCNDSKHTFCCQLDRWISKPLED